MPPVADSRAHAGTGQMSTLAWIAIGAAVYVVLVIVVLSLLSMAQRSDELTRRAWAQERSRREEEDDEEAS